MKIRALKSFEGIKDIERGVYPKEGDIWEVDEERANFLKGHGVIEFVEEKIEMPIVGSTGKECVVPLDEGTMNIVAEGIIKHVEVNQKSKETKKKNTRKK